MSTTGVAVDHVSNTGMHTLFTSTYLTYLTNHGSGWINGLKSPGVIPLYFSQHNGPIACKSVYLEGWQHMPGQ